MSNCPAERLCLPIARRGKWADRKQRWGTNAKLSWKCRKLDTDTWDVPEAVSAGKIEETRNDILVASDRAIIVFPFGKKKTGYSSMSVWTFNC